MSVTYKLEPRWLPCQAPGVLGEIASFICNFSLSVAVLTICLLLLLGFFFAVVLLFSGFCFVCCCCWFVCVCVWGGGVGFGFVLADASLRFISMLFGRKATKKKTYKYHG